MPAIFKREFHALFTTPSGYIFMGTFLAISGVLFTIQILFTRSPYYAEFLGNLIAIFTLVVPLLTMRLFNEEKKYKTEQLLLTSPIRPEEIVLGKYLAVIALFLITLLITVLYPVILSFFGTLEVSKIAGTYFGFFLMGAALFAIGTFIASFSENQASAAIITFCVILLIWIADFLIPVIPASPFSGLVFIVVLVGFLTYSLYRQSHSLLIPGGIGAGLLLITGLIFAFRSQWYDSLIANTLEWFSLTSRFSYFPMGIVDLSDTGYYLSISIIFLFLTRQQIDKKSWAHRV